MIEFLRHATGLCGEPHPSLLTLLMGTPAVGWALYKVKQIKNKTNERIRTDNKRTLR